MMRSVRYADSRNTFSLRTSLRADDVDDVDNVDDVIPLSELKEDRAVVGGSPPAPLDDAILLTLHPTS